MAFVIDDPIIKDIVREVELLNSLDQKILLTRLRVQKLARQKEGSAEQKTKIKPLTMAQIDLIKHEVRKQHARK